jgi:hypothetical protein
MTTGQATGRVPPARGRSGKEARSWQAGDADRSTTRLIVGTYVVAAVGPLLLDASGFGAIATDSLVAWVGIAVGAVGLGVRIWSMRVLGRDYLRSLRTRGEQCPCSGEPTTARCGFVELRHTP